MAVILSATSAQAAVDVTGSSATVTSTGSGTWSFTVAGWSGGGTVSGTFAGTDVDLDGQLSGFSGEVTGFSMSYSGGSIVGAFSLGFADLFGLVYDLDGGVLGDGVTLAVEGIGAIGSGTSFLIGPGPVAICDTGAVCGIIEGPDAGVVPEPAAWALMIAGFGLVGAAARRRKRAMPA